VLATVAAKGEGIEELMAALDRHFDFLSRTGGLRARRRKRLRERVIEVVELKIRQRLWTNAATNDWIETRIGALEAGEATPFAVADELLERSGEILTGARPDLGELKTQELTAGGDQA
jgi:LAO/AO transport system kinase